MMTGERIKFLDLSFWQTNQPTNQPTSQKKDMSEYVSSLAEVKKKPKTTTLKSTVLL